jgi:hypothetical protein
MSTGRKCVYVAPAVVVCRIFSESIMVGSLGRVSADVEAWGSNEVLGDDPASEGGSIYVPW